MSDSAASLLGCRPRLILDHGADEQWADAPVVLGEQGMRFSSRWRFPFGAQLSVKLQGSLDQDERENRHQFHAVGMVVHSEVKSRTASRKSVYETTVLFLDVAEESLETLRRFSLAWAA